VRDNGEIWGTPLKPWQWAEVFALIVVIGVVRLEGDVFDDRTPRIAAGLVLLALFAHILIWIVPVLRRRL
jgi:hypothetical protein